jgi:NADH-quinone oxidoreductase subunit J
MSEVLVFFACAAICVVGALGVILARHPVHSALMLVMTLFGVAVLFIAQEAYFLAAVQVIVYAGAIVVLFLFVIMLVGVDNAEDVRAEPLMGQRQAAAFVGVATLAAAALVGLVVSGDITGARGGTPIDPDDENIRQLGRSLFTEHVLAVEVTAILLTIAVVGAVLLARRPRGELQPVPETEPAWIVRPEPATPPPAPDASDTGDDEHAGPDGAVAELDVVDT